MKKQLTEYEKKSWLAVVFCWIAYTTVYIGRKNLSVCLSDMIADGAVSQAFGGTVGTCFLICYAMGQFINGWLGDHFHPKNMICTGLMAAGIMNIAMGLNRISFMFAIFWALCGFSCSMLWSPIIRAVSTWTTDEISHAAAASLSATIPIGTVFCYLICAAGLRYANWRVSFIICGSILCVMSVILYFCFRFLSSHMMIKAPTAEITEASADKPKTSGFAAIFSVGLMFAAVGILFNGMLKDGLDLWIPTILGDKFIPDSAIVSVICTILPILNIFGAYAARFVFHHFKISELATCGVMFTISTVALAIVTAFVSFTPSKEAGMQITAGDAVLAVFITLLLAISSAAMLGANTMLLTFIPLHYSKIGRASTVTGVLNSFSYVAAAVSSILVGAISENHGWVTVFVFFIAASAVGAVVTILGRNPLRRATDALDAIKTK